MTNPITARAALVRAAAAILTTLVFSRSALRAAPATGLALEALVPFDYRGVTLNDGPLKRQFDETRNYYLRIPDDDLLKGFRKRAGLPAPGVDLGGWYSSDTFHIFGQILSGLSRMYAATGDAACRDKVVALIHEWSLCLRPDGYFFYSDHPNAPHYIYDKMVGGLVDAYRYCGDREALDALRRITDWAVRNLDRKRPFGADFNEWYTLSENLYRAYLATGDIGYRDFGRVWEYTEYWDRYARNVDIFAKTDTGPSVGAYHAYSHVNTLGGAGMAYQITGERHYLDTLKNAYAYLKRHEQFATGGYGPDEQLLPPDPLLAHLADTHNTFETQCGTWAAFKMSKYLLRFTGDAEYGDWIERLVINGIGASIPMSDDGRVFYYSDYNPSGATKANIATGWTCCAGTRPEAIADFHDLIYFRSPDSRTLLVNIYTPSTVRWKSDGHAITVRQLTRFPESDRTRLVVSTAKPIPLTIAFRSPGWLSAPLELYVNGRAASRGVYGRRVEIKRVWRDGDRVDVRLPMSLRLAPLDDRKPCPAALAYGPVVLAWRATPAQIARLPLNRFASELVPSRDEPLTWRVASSRDILIRPFYALKEGEPYLLYIDPAAANHVSFRDVTFTGSWNVGGSFRFGNAVGATASFAFSGTGIRWLGYRFDDAGRAEVRIDGKVVAIVDQYGPGRDLPFDWHINALAPGGHNITITLISERTTASRDRFLNVAGFEIQP